MMNYKIIDSENFKPANWPGGTTTQLFIYPPSADYQKRDFQFRLSTATVETEKSDFTPLPGFSRKLMVLSGEITICHDGHYSRQLKKFDAHEFEGGWKTSSIGKCTDFNLMTAGKTSAELRAVVIKENQSVQCEIRENSDWVFMYLYSGKVSIYINDRNIILKKGDLLVSDQPSIISFEIFGFENSEMVISEIDLP
jgi:environmental stress-induced protein Ves